LSLQSEELSLELEESLLELVLVDVVVEDVVVEDAVLELSESLAPGRSP